MVFISCDTYINSVGWRYNIDRFVIDVWLKRLLRKNRNAHISFKCIKRFLCLWEHCKFSSSFLLTVADISCFARQTCLMIRSRKERHFVHHAMVQTLFSFYQCLFFHLSLSFSLSTLLSVFNQSCPLLCFYATFHFALFLF